MLFSKYASTIIIDFIWPNFYNHATINLLKTTNFAIFSYKSYFLLHEANFNETMKVVDNMFFKSLW